jgi:hypothetical protein
MFYLLAYWLAQTATTLRGRKLFQSFVTAKRPTLTTSTISSLFEALLFDLLMETDWQLFSAVFYTHVIANNFRELFKITSINVDICNKKMHNANFAYLTFFFFFFRFCNLTV